jgi:hypothetical protein
MTKPKETETTNQLDKPKDRDYEPRRNDETDRNIDPFDDTRIRGKNSEFGPIHT